LIRRSCADLVFELSLQHGGEKYSAIAHWREICRENEFAEVRNELLF